MQKKLESKLNALYLVKYLKY